jgi:hypothetical protein
MEDTFPDLGSLSDKELKDLIDNLTAEENEISYKRRVLHGKIDILRAELVNRLRQKRERGDSLISGDDVEQLTNILAGKAQGEDPAGLREALRCPPCTAPSAGSRTPRAPTTARNAAHIWAGRRRAKRIRRR